MKLPAKNQTAVYALPNEETVYVERIAEGRDIWFGLENISQGMSHLPRNRRETIKWLERKGASFVRLVNIPID